MNTILYKKSVLGGTFDRFHLGHQKLVNTAFEHSEKVTIGLTKPALYQNKFLAYLIENYLIREDTLKKYLKERGFEDRAEIIPIDDIYGTTLQDRNIEAIFATDENLQNVNLINAKRREIEFPELKVIIVPYVLDAGGKKITSERIRKGEIDKNGFVYKKIFDSQQILILPEQLRPILQQPLGKIVKTASEVIKLFNDKSIVIAVGDVISSKLEESGFYPAISIIDFRTRRHLFTPKSLGAKQNHPPGDRIINKSGTINKRSVEEIKNSIDEYLRTKKLQTIVIDGEEDLLALPAILLSPLGSIVLYGQFDRGIVVNVVTEELKEKITTLLEKFNK